MNIFSFIKSRVTIWDVVNEYTTLKRAGSYWKSQCPFHHEKTASFTVSPDKEIFYCFGCHTGGDAISFIAQIENCSQLEAAHFLADRYNIDLPQNIEVHEGNAEQKKHYFDVCRLVAQWCHAQLKKNPSVTAYLAKRGIDQKQIDDFMIGYFPTGLSSINTFTHDLKKNHILVDDLIQATILAQGKTVLYSPFEDRIIFPIKDHLGRFCGFGGRIFKAQDTRAKYYNSRENEYFTKGSLLFGLDQAKKSIQKEEFVFLVEGYTDCVAMVQHGYANTVATLGTACTIAHLKLLGRYTPYVYLLYDSDKAGQQAILRLTQLCWQASMELKVVQLPTGQDPDSFLTAGNDLKPRIAGAQDIFEFYIESQGKGFALKPLNEKIALTKTLIEIIQTVGEPLKIDILLQKAANTYEIPFETLRQELERTEPKKATQPNTIPADPPSESVSRLEKKIFCAIINNIDLFNSPNDNYLISYMPDPLGDILQKLKESQKNMSPFEFTQFFDTLSQDEKQYVSKFLLEQEEIIGQEAFKKLVTQFHRQQWKQIVKTIQARLALAKQEGNNEKITQILNDFQRLKQQLVPAITDHQ